MTRSDTKLQPARGYCRGVANYNKRAVNICLLNESKGQWSSGTLCGLLLVAFGSDAGPQCRPREANSVRYNSDLRHRDAHCEHCDRGWDAQKLANLPPRDGEDSSQCADGFGDPFWSDGSALA